MIDFEWDPAKAAANLTKHGIDFADGTEVLFDEKGITLSDPGGAEERFVTIGADAFHRVLVVVYAWRSDRIRLISARKATRQERKEYEEGK